MYRVMKETNGDKWPYYIEKRFLFIWWPHIGGTRIGGNIKYFETEDDAIKYVAWLKQQKNKPVKVWQDG